MMKGRCTMRNGGPHVRLRCAVLVLASVVCGLAASPELTIEIKDYATMPMTGAVDGPGNSAGLLARINFLREEPGGGKRLFVNDLNGPLYIVDKDTKKTTTYLDFNGLPGRTGIFHRLAIDQLLASGFISFEFDPDYSHNGKFYTIHLEDPSLPVSDVPDNTNFPGLNTSGYTVTPSIRTFGNYRARGGRPRMDRHQPIEFDIRRHCPRVAAPAVQRPHSPDGRSDFQPDGAPGRPGLARHVHRDRRRRQR